MSEYDILIDKLDMFYNRIVDANDETKMCLSILRESKENTIFYRENSFLDKLYRQLFKVVIIDLYVVTSRSKEDKNSIYKILNCIKNYKNANEIKEYANLLNYISNVEQRLKNYEDLIQRISTIRSTFIAHIDGKQKRKRHFETVLNIVELESLAKFLFAAVVEIRMIILYGQITPLKIIHHDQYAGINNTFEGLSKKYDKLWELEDK
jgi:hypothetical protein